jgi:hypothetical protein
MFSKQANKMKKSNQIVETLPKSNRKIVDKGKIYTPGTHTHDRSLSAFGTKVAGLSYPFARST